VADTRMCWVGQKSILDRARDCEWKEPLPQHVQIDGCRIGNGPVVRGDGIDFVLAGNGGSPVKIIGVV